MNKDLLDEIKQALTDRQEWAADQEHYYKMRNGGIRRVAKPFQGAADMWYPLGDTMVEKLKPAYLNQMYGGENIATFVAKKQQNEELTSSVGLWFDYKLKQETNFEVAMHSAIDQMLECGFSPVKVYWDADAKRVAFDQVDPLHIIVPSATQELGGNSKADWLVHILSPSVREYKANPNFNQDEDLIKRIKGTGAKDVGDQQKSDATDYREGINCSKNDNEIILWEVYELDRKAKRITVSTISPLLPEDQNSIRDDFALPYNQGCFAGGMEYPFFRIRSEIKDKSYYAPRGIIKINEPFEASLTHNWNAFHDHMSFSSRPNYEQTGASVIPTGKNFKTGPGSILPPGLKMAVHPEPPASLAEDMQMTRAIAEDRTQVPDLGLSQHITDASKDATATQVNAVVAQSGAGTDMRARVFRMDLAVGLKMAWSLYLQYSKDDCLEYITDSKLEALDPSVLHDGYDIQPNGSADSWNKGALVAKRNMQYQKYMANPFCRKDEVTKMDMEADDPRLVKRLFQDPGTQAKDQEEAQAMECLLMIEGFSPQVHEADDDKTHLMNLGQFAENKLMRKQMTPELAQLVLQHGQEHMQGLEQKKDPAAAQIQQMLTPIVQVLTQVAQQPPPNNVVSMMQPQTGNNNQSVQQSPDSTTASSSSQDKPSAIMNALAALIKAGVPISSVDINAILVAAGLPPATPPGMAMHVEPPAQPKTNQQSVGATT